MALGSVAGGQLYNIDPTAPAVSADVKYFRYASHMYVILLYLLGVL